MAPDSPFAPKVSVVILTWNGLELTLECLKSLEVVTTPNVEVIVVDNGSTDGTVTAIREQYGERVTVIANADNLGFSRGNNVGIQYAMEANSDFVLLLNNDTAVDPGFIDAMLAPMLDDASVGITGPKTYFYTPRDLIWFAGGEVFLSRGTARHIGIRERDHGQYDVLREVDYVSGCALLARRSLLESVGNLDPGYRAYFEDVDFCMRAKLAGFRIMYVPAAKVWHKVSASTGGQISRRKIMRKFTSTWRFFRKYARPYHWFTIPLFFAIDVIRILFLVTLGKIRDPSHSRPTGESQP